MKVREVLTKLREDGWQVVRTRGSHRVLKHPTKAGIVVIAGNANHELATDTLRSILRQAGLEERE